MPSAVLNESVFSVLLSVATEEVAKEVRMNLAKANSISSQINESADYLEQSFDAYYSDAYRISSEMLSGEMDFSTLGARSAQMQTNLEVVQNNLDNLPKQFFWFNRLTFFLVVMQMFILSKFYGVHTGETDSNYRGIWIASMILFSVLTSAAAIELYVIITSFITDG